MDPEKFSEIVATEFRVLHSWISRLISRLAEQNIKCYSYFDSDEGLLVIWCHPPVSVEEEVFEE